MRGRTLSARLACLWGSRKGNKKGDGVFWAPSSSEDSTGSLLFVYDLRWELWPCVWASPWQQAVVYRAPLAMRGVGSSILLVPACPIEPLVTAAARFAFWKTGEKVLRLLARHLQLTDLHRTRPWPIFLEGMVRHFHPEFSDTEVLQALLLRAPDEESSLQKLVEEEEFKEYLVKEDREKLEKQSEDRAREKKQQAPPIFSRSCLSRRF